MQRNNPYVEKFLSQHKMASASAARFGEMAWDAAINAAIEAIRRPGTSVKTGGLVGRLKALCSPEQRNTSLVNSVVDIEENESWFDLIRREPQFTRHSPATLKRARAFIIDMDWRHWQTYYEHNVPSKLACQKLFDRLIDQFGPNKTLDALLRGDFTKCLKHRSTGRTLRKV